MYNFKISNHPKDSSIQRIVEDDAHNNNVAISNSKANIKYNFIVRHFTCNVSIDANKNLIIEDPTKEIKELQKNIDLEAIKGRPFPTVINGEIVEIDQYDTIVEMGKVMTNYDMVNLFVQSNDVVNISGQSVINEKCNYL